MIVSLRKSFQLLLADHYTQWIADVVVRPFESVRAAESWPTSDDSV